MEKEGDGGKADAVVPGMALLPAETFQSSCRGHRRATKGQVGFEGLIGSRGGDDQQVKREAGAWSREIWCPGESL